MGIGKRIRDRRADLGMSSMELAERIGVSKQTISGYELERTYPNPEKLSRILKVLKRERNGMTEMEFELLRKYRLLNDHGKFVVESIANIEYDRMLEGLERSRAKKNQ